MQGLLNDKLKDPNIYATHLQVRFTTRSEV